MLKNIYRIKGKFITLTCGLAFIWIGIVVSLEISLGIIVRGIWSKMDHIHQVSFVPNLKGLGAENK